VIGLLVDNNILYRLLYIDDRVFARRFQNIVQKQFEDAGRAHFIASSPFSVLEALCITQSEWKKPKSIRVFDSDDAETTVDKLLDHALKSIDEVECLQQESLLERATTYRAKLSEGELSEVLFKCYIDNQLKDPNFGRSLRTLLAWDWVQQAVAGDLRLLIKVTPPILRAFANARVQQCDVGIYRLLNHHSNAILNKLANDGEIRARESDVSIIRNQLKTKLKSDEDYLDADLIQQLILGSLKRPRHPVAVLTGDRPEQLLARVLSAKGSYELQLLPFIKANPDLAGEFLPRYGEIFVLDQNCELVKEPLSVSNLPVWWKEEERVNKN